MEKSQISDWRAKCPLRRWREERGYSRHDAAAILGVSVDTLQDWEMGTTRPSTRGFGSLLLNAGILANEWDAWLQTKTEEGK